jgi:hypothetical protein
LLDELFEQPRRVLGLLEEALQVPHLRFQLASPSSGSEETARITSRRADVGQCGLEAGSMQYPR